MASPTPDRGGMSIEDIEEQIAALSLLKSQKISEAEAKKSKKDKKKAAKVDVKVPKVHILFGGLIIGNERWRFCCFD
jgi:hypothetical protein